MLSKYTAQLSRFGHRMNASTSKVRGRRLRPLLEVLEDRAVPSSFALLSAEGGTESSLSGHVAYPDPIGNIPVSDVQTFPINQINNGGIKDFGSYYIQSINVIYATSIDTPGDELVLLFRGALYANEPGYYDAHKHELYNMFDGSTSGSMTASVRIEPGDGQTAGDPVGLKIVISEVDYHYNDFRAERSGDASVVTPNSRYSARHLYLYRPCRRYDQCIG